MKKARPWDTRPGLFADASKMVPPVALRSVHLTRDTAGMCVVRINGRVAIRDNGDIIDHMATLEWFADTQQATPEPVGAPTFAQLKQILDGLDRCHARDSKAEFLRVWIRDWAQHKIEQATHPAPGVPEGFALVPVEPTQAMLDALHSSAYLPGCYRALLAAAQAKGAGQ